MSTPPPFLSHADEQWGERQAPAGEMFDAACELGVMLRALKSFFKVGNHPLSETERASLTKRDFAHEASVALDALRRCSQLSIALGRGDAEPSSLYRDERERALPSKNRPGGRVDGEFYEPGAASLDDLPEIVSDLSGLAEAFYDRRPLSFAAWTSFGKVLARQLAHSEAAREVALAASARHTNSPLWAELRAITERVSPDALGSDMAAIFSRLLGLLELLKLIETALAKDRPLKPTLPIFTLLREDALALLELIDERTLRIEGLDTAVAEQLDGTAYAIRMELRKTFEHELVGLAALGSAPQVYAKVENAHGLLRDCLQQSIVALAQIFDPQLEGGRLFGVFKTKLDQSLALRRDLWEVLRDVRRAETGLDYPVTSLVERLQAFRGGSLRHLMYKDWEAYERFVEEAASMRGAAQKTYVLHRFSAYLETLFGQVNMRAVLADYPFVPQAQED